MEIIKNERPDVATSNFRIAFNEVWYDQLCLMRAWVTLGTIFNTLKYLYLLINITPIEGLLYNFYITTTWYPSKCKKGLFPRWGSNSQPRHILTHTVYKYRALTDCATGASWSTTPTNFVLQFQPPKNPMKSPKVSTNTQSCCSFVP